MRGAESSTGRRVAGSTERSGLMIAVTITAKDRRSTRRVGSAGITVASGFGAGAVLAGAARGTA